MLDADAVRRVYFVHSDIEGRWISITRSYFVVPQNDDHEKWRGELEGLRPWNDENGKCNVALCCFMPKGTDKVDRQKLRNNWSTRLTDTSILATASRKINWLEAKETVIARNIANVNTPGFTARKISNLDLTSDALNERFHSANINHIQLRPEDAFGYLLKPLEARERSISGNNVYLEGEMVDQMSVINEHSMTLGIFKAFHQMILTSVK